MNTPSSSPRRSLQLPWYIILGTAVLAACSVPEKRTPAISAPSRRPQQKHQPIEKQSKNNGPLQSPEEITKETVKEVKRAVEKTAPSIVMTKEKLMKETRAIFKDFHNYSDDEKSMAMILYSSAYWDDLYSLEDLKGAFSGYRDLKEELNEKMSDFHGLNMLQEILNAASHMAKLREKKASEKEIAAGILNFDRTCVRLIQAVLEVVIKDKKAFYTAHATPLDVINEHQGDCDSFIYPVWALLKALGIETYLMKTTFGNSGHAQMVYQRLADDKLVVFQLSAVRKDNTIRYTSTEHKDFESFIAFHEKHLFKGEKVKDWAIVRRGLEVFAYTSAVLGSKHGSARKPKISYKYNKEAPYIIEVNHCDSNGITPPPPFSERD